MSSDTIFDYVVVGAGIAGASVAYRLSQRGKAVVVLERESQPGYHSSGRSAAMFMETYGTEHIRALTRASRDFYMNPPPGFCEHPILLPRGALYVGMHGQEGLLSNAQKAFSAQHLAVTELSAREAVQRVPCLLEDKLVGAVYDAVASDMDVHVLHQGFLRGMKAHGASLLCDAELVSAHYVDAVWVLQATGQPEIRTRALVNAAGGWADTVAELCGAKPLGVQPTRRTAFLFSAPDGMATAAWPIVIGVDESFYFKPDAGQLLGSPANADPVPPHDVVAEELDVATGIYRIEAISSLRIRRPSHVWAGLRSFSPDHEFVIGWDCTASEFFWLAGQGGYGIQTAAAASELAAALLCRESLPAHLADYGVNVGVVDPGRWR